MSEQEEDFAAMFEASVKAKRFERGQTVEGVIAGFGPKVAFVSIGGKSEAQIDLEELKDDEGDVEFSVGDRLEAMVVSTGGGIVLSRKGVRSAATQRELEDAFQAGLSVEGKVETANKGGYEVAMLCDASIRRALRHSLARALHDLSVISYQEIPTDLLMEPVAVIRPEDLTGEGSAVAAMFEPPRP